MYKSVSVERYNSLPTEGPSVADLAATGSIPPRSPALSTHTNATIADPRQLQQLHEQATLPTLKGKGPEIQTGNSPTPATALPSSISQSQVSAGVSPVTPSTPATSSATADTGLHLSGHEPRYFPGMVSRTQGRGSMRQESGHESDSQAQQQPQQPR